MSTTTITEGQAVNAAMDLNFIRKLMAELEAQPRTVAGILADPRSAHDLLVKIRDWSSRAVMDLED